jgi:pre-mRNA-splicing factor RBM22/SLT11
MLDLSFGLPIVVRDAALKMVAPGPESSINREYYAQNNEREIEEGRGGLEEYDKTDEKARELLRRLANSEPYYKKQRRLEQEEHEKSREEESEQKLLTSGPGPIRTSDALAPQRGGPYSRPGGSSRGGRGGARGGARVGTGAIPKPEDILPPRDQNITSLFVTGVEDDLPEHAIRSHFTPFGKLRSVVCSHRAHCAFINYMTREGAEAAADACQGRAVIQGCPLRVAWGKPRTLDSMETDERMMLARQGRDTVQALKERALGGGSGQGGMEAGQQVIEAPVALPPGQDEPQYASLAGD